MKSPWDSGGVSSAQIRVSAQEVHNSWSDYWILLKYLHEFLEAVFLGDALKLLLNTHSIWSAKTKDHTSVSAKEVRNSWTNCWIVLKFLQEFQEPCFFGIAMKSPRDAGGVSSGHTSVPAQEVHNSWSDRWMVLKFLHEFVEVVFLGVTMKSKWDDGGVSSGQTRVMAQEVHNCWSDRWIMLKFLQEFPEAVFLSVTLILLLDTPSVLSGHTKNQTSVPAQEVRNSLSDHWIMFKFLQEFPESVFLGVTLIMLLDTPNIWSGHTKNHTRVRAQQVHNSWSDHWIVFKFLQKFSEDVCLRDELKLLLETHGVWSAKTKDLTWVPAQEVRTSWSNR